MRSFLSFSLVTLLLVQVPVSCNLVSSILHDDEVVARVGKEKLYRSEVDAVIPDMISPADSAGLAERYISSWASQRLYARLAEKELSKSELDVSAELEYYRRTLVKYRYEQRYLNDRLDTLITEAQIRDYYMSHQEDFRLQRPIMKVRFVNVMKDSPVKDELLRLMASDDYDDLAIADSLARSGALRYFDNSETWIDSRDVARAFSIDLDRMLSMIRNDMIVLEPEGRGDLLAAYVYDMVRSGTAPIEYCSDAIRDIILSSRKQELLAALERDLLDNALENKQFVIY